MHSRRHVTRHHICALRGCALRGCALRCARSFLAAVDEQNAQTQEQEGFTLGLAESEEKKDSKLDDRVCPTESCGVTKARSLRKGTGRP